MTEHVAPVWRSRPAPSDPLDRTPGWLEFIPYGWSLVSAPDDNELLLFDPARPHPTTAEPTNPDPQPTTEDA